MTIQRRVHDWMLQCFGEEIAADRMERNARFLEEALELVQSLGLSEQQAHVLVAYVFGRPIGEPAQEAGGVMLTLAALCNANGLDMELVAEAELHRVWGMIEQIRAKQANKPKGSVLPEAPKATPAASWRIDCGQDPHGTSYDQERAQLAMGDLTDDELANGAFLNYDMRPSPQQILAGTHRSPIAWMTAVKERIRWLSRRLVEATEQLGRVARLRTELLNCADDFHYLTTIVENKEGLHVWLEKRRHDLRSIAENVQVNSHVWSHNLMQQIKDYGRMRQEQRGKECELLLKEIQVALETSQRPDNIVLLRKCMEEESAAADELLRLLNLPPESYRTEGGAINLNKVKAALQHPNEYPTMK